MKKYAALLSAFVLLAFTANNLSFAVSEKQPTVKNVIKIDIESELYQQARIELNKSLYQSYRIVERISRANNLNDFSWRIYIPSGISNSEINAYAADGNLVVLFPLLVDIFSDDVSSLAFVIAHEMAHNYLKHPAKYKKYEEQTKEEYKEFSCPKEMEAEEILKERFLLSEVIGFWSAYFIYNLRAKDFQNDINNKQEAINEDLFGFSRKLEYEADKTALIYLIRAGFDLNKAPRSFELMDRLPEAAYEPTTHPSNKNRAWQIKSLLKTLDIQKLKAEGQRNFKNSKPLTYERSLDKKSLKINSKFGSYGDVNEPFKKLFGK